MHWDRIVSALSGATVIGALSHMVNTFPIPSNPYAKWLLGSIQYIVGQRENASNTINTPTLPRS